MLGFDAGFDMGFGIMETLMPVFMMIALGIFLAAAVRGVRQWAKNNHSPVLTVEASVVNMRHKVSHHSHAAPNHHMAHSTSATYYYVTFQVESGDRVELMVDGREYGQLAQGDAGRLTLKGTRYLGFQRH